MEVCDLSNYFYYENAKSPPYQAMPYPHFYNPEKLILLKKKRINESRMD
jgi:hypothetical protein